MCSRRGRREAAEEVDVVGEADRLPVGRGTVRMGLLGDRDRDMGRDMVELAVGMGTRVAAVVGTAALAVAVAVDVEVPE